ncbi:hypothetical protein [Ravibacter arvi]|uniref:hypothetical protein n=1 Tax=Ravibacter arvi TaxID=2051041 RepID=UPI0031EF9F50
MEKLHDYQTVSALEKATHEFDTLIRFTRCTELQTSLWHMFQDSLCQCDDRSIPDDILIRTELYDTLRNILTELDKVATTPDHAFTISYGPKSAH